MVGKGRWQQCWVLELVFYPVCWPAFISLSAILLLSLNQTPESHSVLCFRILFWTLTECNMALCWEPIHLSSILNPFLKSLLSSKLSRLTHGRVSLFCCSNAHTGHRCFPLQNSSKGQWISSGWSSYKWSLGLLAVSSLEFGPVMASNPNAATVFEFENSFPAMCCAQYWFPYAASFLEHGINMHWLQHMSCSLTGILLSTSTIFMWKDLKYNSEDLWSSFLCSKLMITASKIHL